MRIPVFALIHPNDIARRQIMRFRTAEQAATWNKEHFDPAYLIVEDPDFDARYACSECGSLNIEGTAWIDLNTGAEMDGDPPLDEIWCPECEDHYKGCTILDEEPKDDHADCPLVWSGHGEPTHDPKRCLRREAEIPE